MKKNSKSKIKSNSPLPLYFQIKEDLKSKIENGILNEGEYLPSEFKLMERYGVSRPTIRQAVENLCQENFLEKQETTRNRYNGQKQEFQTFHEKSW